MKYWKSGILLLLIVLAIVIYLEYSGTKQPVPEEVQTELIEDLEASPESNRYGKEPTPYLRRDVTLTLPNIKNPEKLDSEESSKHNNQNQH